MLRQEVLPSGEANINLPVNLKRLIWNAKERFQCNNNRIGPTGEDPVLAQPILVYICHHLLGCNSEAINTLLFCCLFATGLSPLRVIQEVQQLCSELHVVVGNDELSLEAKRNATLLFHAFLRATLASKRVLSEHRLSEDAFNYLIGEIKTRFNEVSWFSAHHV